MAVGVEELAAGVNQDGCEVRTIMKQNDLMYSPATPEPVMLTLSPNPVVLHKLCFRVDKILH